MPKGEIPEERGKILSKEEIGFALTVARRIISSTIVLKRLVILPVTRQTSSRIHHHLRPILPQIPPTRNPTNKVLLLSPIFNLHRKCIKASLKLFNSQSLVLSLRPIL
jgi:hypothetical protein